MVRTIRQLYSQSFRSLSIVRNSTEPGVLETGPVPVAGSYLACCLSVRPILFRWNRPTYYSLQIAFLMLIFIFLYFIPPSSLLIFLLPSANSVFGLRCVWWSKTSNDSYIIALVSPLFEWRNLVQVVIFLICMSEEPGSNLDCHLRSSLRTFFSIPPSQSRVALVSTDAAKSLGITSQRASVASYS
jgi:hypothetical protein